MTEEEMQEQIAAWEEKFHQAEAAHRQEVARLELDYAIREAGGRNVKAIMALVDLEQAQDAGQAVAAVKKECPYLFQEVRLPAYAPGTGAGQVQKEEIGSLAEALRARFAGK